MSEFYFNSSGMLKFTGGASAMSVVQNGLYGTSYSKSGYSNNLDTDWKKAALEASGLYNSANGSTGTFSDAMKNAAISNSGGLNNNQKEAIRNQSGNFVKIEAARARLAAIQSSKPKTYDYSSDDWVYDMIQDKIANGSSIKNFIPRRPDSY